ncbi:MAG: putative pyrophosphatase [Bacteroidetes bacterium]|nr:putative pyrophosphatase [Bacteroidota bacterium]
MLIEESYEVVETIDDRNYDGLKKELGDILLHIAMHSTIAEESGAFTFREVLDEISKKLIRRHPHVFGKLTVRNAGEVKKNWEELKMTEGRTSVLEGVPKGLPALQQALRIQERASRVGFDWKRKEDVWKKILEELRELKATLRSRSKKRQEEELGDFLFSVVNYARAVGINPEGALRGTIRKFVDRFHFIEKELQARGKDINDSTLEEMDALWTKAKRVRRREKPLSRGRHC